MTSRIRKSLITSIAAIGLFAAVAANAEMRFAQVAAQDKFQRSKIADLGFSIEAVRSDSVWGFATEEILASVNQAGFTVLGIHDEDVGYAGQAEPPKPGFPTADDRYHTYAETIQALRSLQSKHADIARVVSLGQSIESRDIWAIHINSDPEALMSGQSGKPGAVFMGAHHAREHLTVEVPLMLAQHLLTHREDASIARLLDTRDIWIIPMVNPDGAEFDIATGKYAHWRKNRRDNWDGNFGVDLNRNYGYKWGQGGSSKLTSSDTYMGEAPFSEPETKAMKEFIESHLNIKTLLTFHSYSELILYPWGHTHDPIAKADDQAVFTTMAQTMAAWNKYKPEQSSDLYITTGDTTDWAYAEHGIFAFTFELSPGGFGSGGFYPGPKVIDKVFADNLRPSLYMIEVADDPYKVIQNKPSRWLPHYVEPRLPADVLWP